MADEQANLMIARRLMVMSGQLSIVRNGKKFQPKSLKEAMEEEDQALISGEAQSVAARKSSPPQDNVNIKLSDLIRRMDDLKKNPSQGGDAAARETTTVAFERSETEINIKLQVYQPVEGLVVRNKQLAETDRYAFEFQDGGTFKITDKWSGKSTTIWGDPHVDTSDEEGSNNGDFKDLTGSDSHTTLMLEDGTRLTFTAKDAGIIEEVDIFKGSQHLNGIGAGSNKYGGVNSLFDKEVKSDANSVASSVPLGDVVYAGGDGNDWFDSIGRLVWGKTTGPKPTARPYATLEVSIRQTQESGVFTSTVDRQA